MLLCGLLARCRDAILVNKGPPKGWVCYCALSEEAGREDLICG